MTTKRTDFQSPTSYIPAEGRYCTNFFDEELLVPNRKMLAWSIAELPALGQVLDRAYRMSFIPSMPNMVQISEYVTPYSGFGRHRKHACLGPYIGILNLVSPEILRLAHFAEPWCPRIYMEPCALIVLQKSARYDYFMSTIKINESGRPNLSRGRRSAPEETTINFTRHTRDYRVEVVFASVDSQNIPALDLALKINASITM